jgi:hypothetical protein
LKNNGLYNILWFWLGEKGRFWPFFAGISHPQDVVAEDARFRRFPVRVEARSKQAGQIINEGKRRLHCSP